MILGGNPVYNAPADLALPDACEVKLRVLISGSTTMRPSALCHWHVPERITWSPGATRAATTARSRFMQPLIAPLYRGKSAHEFASRSWRSAGAVRATIIVIMRVLAERHGSAISMAGGASRCTMALVPDTALRPANVSRARRRV